jgi:TetR/AcrR family transcriptional regulator, regulator of biofilm formation and stress response
MAASGRGSPSPGGEGYWALIRAVPRVVARVGFRGLTHREVAREAGVTYGLVGYHFGSREALIHQAALTATKEAIAEAHIVPAGGELDDFASGLTKVVSEDTDAQAFQYELAFEARRVPALLEHVRDLYRQYFDATSNALAELDVENDPAMARVVFAALDGLALQQLIFDRPDETDEAVERLREILRLLRERASATES